MNEQEFLEKLVEIMDTEENLEMDSILADIEEWDSLSHISFLAMCATFAKKKVSPTAVKVAKTPRELYSLITGEA